MDSAPDFDDVVRRTRLAYEWGRAKRAIFGAVPALILMGGAAVLGDTPRWALAFGGALFLVSCAMLWYGRDPQRAVLPGLVAGILPLVLVLASRHLGHFCTGASCTTLCIQACTIGGMLAGFGVASAGNASRAGLGFWVAASAIAILTGAMACSCLGIAGIVGLSVGFGVGAVPALLGRAFVKAP